MMTSRFAVGSVSTLALGALLLGSASFLANRPSPAAHGTPWGNISSLSPAAAATAQADDQARLLKLAALKGGDGGPAAPAPAEQPAPSASVAAAPAPVAPPVPAPVPSSDDTTATAAPASAPVEMASAADPAPAAEVSVQDEPAAKSARINLNTAPASQLDRIPGLGRVGRSIVAHRPYRSVKDLVSKRVLRTSDYQKIASYVGVE